jgi:hypothetical protein
MLHRDTGGDRQCDFVRTSGQADDALVQNGSIIRNPANVSVVGTAAQARTQPTADVNFISQRAAGGTVTVRSANLSQGGFVAIHRGEGSSGPIIGVSRRLAAGGQRDVRVELFNVSSREFPRSSLSGSRNLTAAAYLDSNSSSRFDYMRTNGSADFPYLDNGSIVTNPATVNATGGSGATGS